MRFFERDETAKARAGLADGKNRERIIDRPEFKTRNQINIDRPKVASGNNPQCNVRCRLHL
ncbi:MAG TPA: hypothetical protein DC042_14240 [Bacteroidales bacterium]|nr:hypothetical protein [Bacteroidales bacterium]